MPPDHHEIEKVEIRLKQACKNLHDMVDDVASARQIKEYDSERRKLLLARCSHGFHLAPDGKLQPITRLEAMARMDAKYQEEINLLSEQYKEAERIIAKWQATMASFEAARSLLSFSRESLRQI